MKFDDISRRGRSRLLRLGVLQRVWCFQHTRAADRDLTPLSPRAVFQERFSRLWYPVQLWSFEAQQAFLTWEVSRWLTP